MMRALAMLLLATLPLAAASVSGVVTNRTSGKPEPRVALTLISFAQGMDPIEEVYSDPDGKFEFVKEVPGMGMLRTDHQGRHVLYDAFAQRRSVERFRRRLRGC